MAKSDLVVIWGTNPASTLINVMTHAIRARKERGARIAVVDVYETETVRQADIGLEGVSPDRLKTIGDACASEGSLCGSHCFKVTPDAVVDAMIAADALGAERKHLAGI